MLGIVVISYEDNYQSKVTQNIAVIYLLVLAVDVAMQVLSKTSELKAGHYRVEIRSSYNILGERIFIVIFVKKGLLGMKFPNI